jgi:hypothetical protein
MDAKEMIKKIKELFNQVPVVAPAPVAPVLPVAASGTEHTLQDGTQVMVSALEAGGTVTVKDEAGNETPAAAGDYQLQDGTLIKVSEGGVISEVVPAVAPAAAPELSMQEMISAAVAQAMSDYETKAAQKLAEQTAQIPQILEVQKQTMELVEFLVKEPTAKPDPAATVSLVNGMNPSSLFTKSKN